MGKKLLKREKTCRCIATLETENNNIRKNPEAMIQFHSGREYQVDIFFTFEKSYYKVYQNGGWDDYARMSEEEFNRNFKLID